MGRKRPFSVCPNCGESFPVGRPACPECGSDENTGWKDPEEVFLSSIDLPEDLLPSRDPVPRPSFLRRPWVRRALVVFVVLALLGPVLLGLIGFLAMPFIGR